MIFLICAIQIPVLKVCEHYHSDHVILCHDFGTDLDFSKMLHFKLMYFQHWKTRAEIDYHTNCLHHTYVYVFNVYINEDNSLVLNK